MSAPAIEVSLGVLSLVGAPLILSVSIWNLQKSSLKLLLLRSLLYFAVSASLWFLTGGAGAFVIVALACLAIVESDMRWYLIPDICSASLLAVGYFSAGLDDLLVPTVGAIFGACLFMAVRVGFHRLRGFHGLGLGDVKLASAMGGVLGPQDLSLAIAGGAAITVLLYIVISRASPAIVAKVHGHAAAPLGVGLAAACVILLAIKGMTPWR